MADLQQTPSTRRQNAIPTNMITYKGRRMPARIDPDARVPYIVEVMCQNFNTKEHHITLCLRDEADNLVTQSNIASKVRDHEELKLVPSPTTEALIVVQSLKAATTRTNLNDSTPGLLNTPTDTIPLKLALFNLSKYVKEEDFAVEFMLRGGVRTVIRLLERDEGGLLGNSLAYALQGIRGILEFEASWADLTNVAVDRILNLLVVAPQLNVLRPATAIIRKVVISSPQVGAKRPNKGKSKAGTQDDTLSEGSGERFGFDQVWQRMEGIKNGEDAGQQGVKGLFGVLVKRLEGTGDLELVSQSLGLINACLRTAMQENSRLYPDLVDLLEHLNIRRYISRLMPTCSNNSVEPQILNFQARYAGVLQYRRHKLVRPAQHPEQERMLSDIWHVGRLSGGAMEGMSPGRSSGEVERLQGGGRRGWEGWARIGLGLQGDEEGEEPFLEVELFRDVGDLGLECLHWFAMHEDNFHNLVIEQEARLPERRCPIGPASAECVKILCEHYKVSQAGHHAPSHFQLFLLNFPRLHSLILKFFLRMWSESESRLDDFDRLSFLVRSQVRQSLLEESTKTWLHLERDFLEGDYRSIRDRQMEVLESEDGMLARGCVRELRERLGREAYDVLEEQRIGCMLQGGWFNSGLLMVQGINPNARPNPAKPLRFIRLSPNRKTLAWDEFATRSTVTPAYDTLRERIDIANITDLRVQTSRAINSRSPSLISKLSFSLMSGPELSLLDLDAVHAAQLAEWADGVRALRGEGGMATKETAGFVHIMAELALRVRLLDVTGDGVEIPEKLIHGPAPSSVDFWFAK